MHLLSFHSLHEVKIDSIIDILLKRVWLSIWGGISKISYWEPRELEWLQDFRSRHWPGALFSFSKRCEFDLFIGHQGCHIQLRATRMKTSPRSSIWGMPTGSPGPSWSHSLPHSAWNVHSYFCWVIILLLKTKSNINKISKTYREGRELSNLPVVQKSKLSASVSSSVKW